MEPRQKWALRFWSVVAAIAAWSIAQSLAWATEPSWWAVVLMATSVALATVSVLMIPIDHIWLRWVFNLVVFSAPMLVSLAVVIRWIQA